MARCSSETPEPPSTWWLIAVRCASTSPTSRNRLRRAGTAVATVLVQADLAQQVEVREHFAGPEHHRRERVLGDRDRQPGFLAQQAVEVPEQRAAAGEHDAAVDDVGAE